MTYFKGLMLIGLFACRTVLAEPATEKSVRELFELSEFSKTAATVRISAEAQFNQLMEAAEKGKALSPEDREIAEGLKSRAREMIREAFSVEKIEAMQIRLNQEIFTEDEVVGMIAFYRTTVGQALLKKGKLLTLRSVIETKKMMDDTNIRVLKMMEESLAETRGKGR